ncbi:RNA polymerase sigma factor [Pinibacter soli]|uniref:RNA polymerase sigma factor n=1 Tax=Pinibacter soli TaxID=3044211 RepID=A0ABT6RG07_9BACT|nr:RNA polymerase sigma factor [Pinibacter soli]MDI3321499.1 RNA polymerase sigma factor [Pinibacter soli]
MQQALNIPEIIQQKTNAALNGNICEMGAVFEFFRPRLYALALRICSNSDTAQDAVQGTFIAAFTHLHTLRNNGSFYPWLKHILINSTYQLLRKKKFNQFSESTCISEQMIFQSVHAAVEKTSYQQQLYSSLQALSDELRSCVLLRYFSNYNSYEEIAAILCIPVGTVRSRLSAARQKLSQVYNKFEDAGDKILKNAKEWSGYYYRLWSNLYDDAYTRNELFDHLHPAINIRFTSGKYGKGRQIVEKEINEDLVLGTRFNVHDVISCGNISIIEGPNINTPEYPDRCAPSSVYVLFRNPGKAVETIHVYDAPRK